MAPSDAILPFICCSTCSLAKLSKSPTCVRCLDGVDLATVKPHLFDGKNWEHMVLRPHAHLRQVRVPAVAIVCLVHLFAIMRCADAEPTVTLQLSKADYVQLSAEYKSCDGASIHTC
jgi:hypothetical protein